MDRLAALESVVETGVVWRLRDGTAVRSDAETDLLNPFDTGSPRVKLPCTPLCRIVKVYVTQSGDNLPPYLTLKSAKNRGVGSLARDVNRTRNPTLISSMLSTKPLIQRTSTIVSD